MSKLNTFVHVRHPETGAQVVLGPADNVPDWARKAITNPDVWEDPDYLGVDREAAGPGDTRSPFSIKGTGRVDPDAETDEEDYDSLGNRALRRIIRQRREEAAAAGQVERASRLQVTGQKDQLLKVLRADDTWVALNENRPEDPTTVARRGEDSEDDEDDESEDDEGGDVEGYASWNVADLRNEAKRREIKNASSMNKGDLVRALEADDAESEDEDDSEDDEEA